MTGPEYADNLYYVWGFHGILVIDASSHTEAQGVYSRALRLRRHDSRALHVGAGSNPLGYALARP